MCGGVCVYISCLLLSDPWMWCCAQEPGPVSMETGCRRRDGHASRTKKSFARFSESSGFMRKKPFISLMRSSYSFIKYFVQPVLYSFVFLMCDQAAAVTLMNWVMKMIMVPQTSPPALLWLPFCLSSRRQRREEPLKFSWRQQKR